MLLKNFDVQIIYNYLYIITQPNFEQEIKDSICSLFNIFDK